MAVIGIIAEYNPFHSGHRYHIRAIRQAFGPDCGVICVMSGNWVQRGDAAIADKWTRSAMSLRGGADLVLELPTVWAVSSAEGFARGALSILEATGLVDVLSFGSETGDLAPLLKAAQVHASKPYQNALRRYLDAGLSFPLARQLATDEQLGQTEASCLKQPNNNLGVEYLRAIEQLGSRIRPHTVLRQGAAHDSLEANAQYVSASYLRERLLAGFEDEAQPHLSTEDLAAIQAGGLASLSLCTQGVLTGLRRMELKDFLALPDCGEGLHNRLAQAAQSCDCLEALYTAVKSRRYTHARIRRLVLWAFLGLTAQDRPTTPPYLRVLGMSRRGQALLKSMKKTAACPVLTKAAHIQRLPQDAQRLFNLEARCTNLYELCRADFSTCPKLSEFTSNPVLL